MNRTVMRHLQEPLACEHCPLRCVGAFAAVSASELAFIQDLKTGEAVLPAGSRVRHEGVADGDCYTLRAGWAFRFRMLPSGARQILNFLLPGDFFGLTEHLALRGQHGVDVLTRAVLCRFPASRVAQMCEKQPRLGSHITRLAAYGEALLAESLASVGQKSALQRIATLLVDLYRRAEAVGLKDAAGAIEFPLTQRHMADALGMSLIHTHRTLRALDRSGLFTLDGLRLTVRDPGQLSAFADYHGQPARERPLL